MSGESPDSGQRSGLATPARAAKAKKRVGFQASESDRSSIVGLVEGSHSPLPSPPPPMSTETPPNAPDAMELHLALTRILTAEGEDDQGNYQEVTVPLDIDVETSSPRASRTARPVLRRNTSYDADKEKEEADKMEKLATQRQVRSMADARGRADRLAVSLHSHSAPGSRRNSDEIEATFRIAIDDDDEEEGQASGAPEPQRVGQPIDSQPGFRRRNTVVRRRDDENPHREIDPNHAEAQRLIEALMAREDEMMLSAPSSGASTPTLQQSSNREDYVPRPARPLGSLLSQMLPLLMADRGSLSAQTTPATTPGSSPVPSPPDSRRASLSGPRPAGNRGLGFLRRHNHSTSSISSLLKSSSMLSAPASSNISDQWGTKIGSETAKSRKEAKKEARSKKLKITKNVGAILSRHRYLIKLCRALMMYGAPTHRLEEYMLMSARVLEIEAQFLYIPSCMIISFDDYRLHTAEVKIVRVPQGIDLGRLRDVHNIYKEVVHDKVGVDVATDRLETIMRGRPKFGVWYRVLMYGLASASVAPFAFQGRFIDMPIAFILGCLVGILQLVCAPNNELYSHVFEVSAAIITSFISRGFGSINGGKTFCFSALAQSSIALILPGYLVLCSSLELQSHNIVAGSVRMVYAMIYTLFLGYGITIGASLYGIIDPNAESRTYCEAPLQRGWYFLFVPCFTLCLCIVNQAKWKQMPVMVVMALAGFCVNSYSGTYFQGSSQISNMLGALTVGILANLYSRLGRHAENFWLDGVEWYDFKVRPRLQRLLLRKKSHSQSNSPSGSDIESRPGSPEPAEKLQRQPRKIGYSLAAAAMLPAIFVQVPSGLAAGGSLLAGITSANRITGNATVEAEPGNLGNLDGTTFNVLFSVIQVAIGISVGLFMSALIVYPLGKRRSGLFSF